MKEQAAQAAAQARTLGRFLLPVRADALGQPSLWAGFPRGPERSESGPTALQLPFFEIILRAATSCRVFDTPQRGRRDAARSAQQRAIAGPATYLRRRRGRIEVGLNAPGIRADLEFWCSLTRHGSHVPLFTVPRRRLDFAALVAPTDGPVFATLRYDLPATALSYARAATARGDAVVLGLVTMGIAGLAGRAADAVGIAVVVFAAPAVAGRLAAIAVERGRRDTITLEASEARARTPVLLLLASHLQGDLDIHAAAGGDPEKRLRSHLERAAKKRGDWQTARRAAAAAELVAFMEGRGAEPAKDWGDLAREHYAELGPWAAEQDRLSADTVTLARAVAGKLSPNRLADPTLITAGAKAAERDQWRTSLADVMRRLDAAIVGRKVRAAAPNARPAAATRRVIEELATPERWAELPFYALRDDVLALGEFLRAETGAALAVTATTGELRELTSPWDAQQVVDEAFGGAFDQRHIEDFREKQHGIAFVVWWPEVSSGPVVRERRPRPEDEEEDAMLRELAVGEVADRPPYEVVGWGLTRLLFRGACKEQRAEHLVLRSVWEYPTGKELNRSRYAGTGPWREVDWPALRRMIKRVRAALQGPLAGGRTAGSRPVPVLRAARARVTQGWRLADRYGIGSVKLA